MVGDQSRQDCCLNQIAKDAVELKFTEKPLTKEQLADLIRIPAKNA